VHLHRINRAKALCMDTCAYVLSKGSCTMNSAELFAASCRKLRWSCGACRSPLVVTLHAQPLRRMPCRGCRCLRRHTRRPPGTHNFEAMCVSVYFRIGPSLFSLFLSVYIDTYTMSPRDETPSISTSTWSPLEARGSIYIDIFTESPRGGTPPRPTPRGGAPPTSMLTRSIEPR
jgi:hypothetical protein